MFRVAASKYILSAVSAWTAVGPYIFDWNETHIYNPTWPGHAKFHNAQTMSTGALCGLSALAVLWSTRGTPSRPRIQVAAGAASIFWVTQLSAVLYPGTVFQEEPRHGAPQAVIATTMLGLIALGFVLGATPGRSEK
jgi:hypothetical protein